MTLKVTIRPTEPVNGAYPTYFVDNDGVNVGPSGELTLVAAFDDEGFTPVGFRIYAPGTWSQIDAELAE